MVNLIALVLSLPLALAFSLEVPSVLTGTFGIVTKAYDETNVNQNCMTKAGGLFASAQIFSDEDGSAGCNRYLRVWGPQGYVDVLLAGPCEECEENQLDLSSAAYQKIAGEDDLRVSGYWELL